MLLYAFLTVCALIFVGVASLALVGPEKPRAALTAVVDRVSRLVGRSPAPADPDEPAHNATVDTQGITIDGPALCPAPSGPADDPATEVIPAVVDDVVPAPLGGWNYFSLHPEIAYTTPVIRPARSRHGVDNTGAVTVAQLQAARTTGGRHAAPAAR